MKPFVAIEVGWWGHGNSLYYLSTFGRVWYFLQHRVNMPSGSQWCLWNVVFHSCPLVYLLVYTFPTSIYLGYLIKLKLCPILDFWIWTPESKVQKAALLNTLCMWVICTPHFAFNYLHKINYFSSQRVLNSPIEKLFSLLKEPYGDLKYPSHTTV